MNPYENFAVEQLQTIKLTATPEQLLLIDAAIAAKSTPVISEALKQAARSAFQALKSGKLSLSNGTTAMGKATQRSYKEAFGSEMPTTDDFLEADNGKRRQLAASIQSNLNSLVWKSTGVQLRKATIEGQKDSIVVHCEGYENSTLKFPKLTAKIVPSFGETASETDILTSLTAYDAGNEVRLTFNFYLIDGSISFGFNVE